MSKSRTVAKARSAGSPSKALSKTNRPFALEMSSFKSPHITGLKLRKKTTRIIIHCSATRPSQDIDAAEIDRWHRERGWKCIGYHLVIKRNGEIDLGRGIGAVGAHAKGYNHTSVSVCLVGGIKEKGTAGLPEANFTMRQWVALRSALQFLKQQYPQAKVIGHCDVDPAKACPTFDATVLV